ncbi:hypothetical protein C7416_103588 [Cupriavidus phytorum]|uniref:Uncharacterized protein n=1 Tax=Cupriavidus phytorum TaxID=3024399 RepID=A0A2W7PWC1_9BURK|nr:hypothetical protein [Cupriavidus alkaliphilus]PZX30855.1 hypothetical protein C7416_103588 [Cupriavidus alkaliphilus]
MTNESKIAAARTARLAQTQSIARSLLARCYDGTASPRQAIKAFCIACVGERRKDVANCTCYACPLYRYRPAFSTDARGSELDAQESSESTRDMVEDHPDQKKDSGTLDRPLGG